jgi:hypothetical protein
VDPNSEIFKPPRLTYPEMWGASVRRVNRSICDFIEPNHKRFIVVCQADRAWLWFIFKILSQGQATQKHPFSGRPGTKMAESARNHP